LAYIEQNYKDEAVIMEDDWKLKAAFEQFGDEWFIEDGLWSLTNKCDKWNDTTYKVSYYQDGDLILSEDTRLTEKEAEKRKKELIYAGYQAWITKENE
jgi:hypothetical protein